MPYIMPGKSLPRSALLLLAACSGTSNSKPSADAGPASVDVATYHKDVRPILEARCVGCHSAGGIAPFDLTSYASAKNWADAIVSATSSRRMPPWGAQETGECKPPHAWKDDIRLSDVQIAQLAAWRTHGTAEGRAEDFQRIGAPVKAMLDSAVDLKPSEAYTPQPGSDVLRCYELDPKLDKTRYMTGFHIVPSNKSVVHHALAFSVPKASVVPASPYDCFGGPKVDGATLVSAWAPGGVPQELPAGMGTPIEAGSRFILQVHYHPHAKATPEPDATTFQVRFSDAVPDYWVITRLIGNFRGLDAQGNGLLPGPADNAGSEFRIPAGAEAHEEVMKVTLQAGQPRFANTRILGVGAHMHLAGYDERISLEHPGSAETCLMQEPSWDFDWQRGYQYNVGFESLPHVDTGDTLRMRCRYNNSSKNAKVSEALKERGMSSPIEIKLGEETLDEMCLGAFAFVFPRPI
jgi:mono/diheme cytochrome c family protein